VSLLDLAGLMGKDDPPATSDPHIAGAVKIHGRAFSIIFSKSKSREKDHNRGGNSKLFKRKKATWGHCKKVRGKPTFAPTLTEVVPRIDPFHHNWICFL